MRLYYDILYKIFPYFHFKFFHLPLKIGLEPKFRVENFLDF